MIVNIKFQKPVGSECKERCNDLYATLGEFLKDKVPPSINFWNGPVLGNVPSILWDKDFISPNDRFCTSY